MFSHSMKPPRPRSPDHGLQTPRGAGQREPPNPLPRKSLEIYMPQKQPLAGLPRWTPGGPLGFATAPE